MLAFAFAAKAQAVLNAQQLGNLVVGLKGALKENLMPIANGEASYNAVVQRWDARRDLAGKTKSQVIDLLYSDVEVVVKSSAVRYQINQVFALYDRMPDSQFSAKTSFKDPRDGEVYGIKKLGNRTWMKENLRYDMGNDSICYDDDGENCAEFGMLYTFNGAMKACPTGWRLPSDNDWMDLENALGMPQNQLMVDGYSTTRGYREGLMLQVGRPSTLAQVQDGETLTNFERARKYIADPKKNYLVSNEEADYNELFSKLVMFHQLRSFYGWDVIKRLHQYFRKQPYVEVDGETDADKANRFIYAMCVVTQNDLVPFFRKWGLNADAATTQKINGMRLPLPKTDPSTIFK